MSEEKEATTLVLFGATGDLAKRSLWPAMTNLAARKMLPKRFRVIAAAFDLDEKEFPTELRGEVRARLGGEFNEQAWTTLMENTRMLKVDFNDSEFYDRLVSLLKEVEGEIGSDDTVFYFSVFTNMVEQIIAGLNNSGCEAAKHARLVLEKPFGRDLASARELDEGLKMYLPKATILRTDHYLGKETVQNLLTLRFANSIFEPLWNRNYIDSVSITVAEEEGIGNRAATYEPTGALRDVLQNHIMQLLAYVAMEPPVRFSGAPLWQEKVKVLAATRVHDVGRDVVRARYVAGNSGAGYLEEDDVAADSETETYVAARLYIDNWRWEGTPFLLKTGKRLAERRAEIAIRFKPTPHLPLDEVGPLPPNELIITLQPDEGIALRTIAKTPGESMQLQPVMLDFFYATAFEEPGPAAYERLLHSALLGEPSLFMSAEEIEAAWRVMQPILDHWESDDAPMREYAAGSEGPEEAAAVLSRP
jgi:glucose-6-phosphate 1-dehydrogenase